jgi:hypothetical protein
MIHLIISNCFGRIVHHLGFQNALNHESIPFPAWPLETRAKTVETFPVSNAPGKQVGLP